jgi:hypothetical protein
MRASEREILVKVCLLHSCAEAEEYKSSKWKVYVVEFGMHQSKVSSHTFIQSTSQDADAPTLVPRSLALRRTHHPPSLALHSRRRRLRHLQLSVTRRRLNSRCRRYSTRSRD